MRALIAVLVAAVVATTPLPAAAAAPAPVTPVVATFRVVNETFRVKFTEPQEIELAWQLAAGKIQRFPLGTIVWGVPDVNVGYTWHLDPARLVPNAVEVCDGLPSRVNRDTWRVPVFCPWSARLVTLREA